MGTPASFKPGQSGNPKGRPKADWTWSGLLRDLADELHEETGQTKKQIIAKALFKEAHKGNIIAIKEFGDRIDGKAPQFIDHTTKGDKLPTPIYGGKSKV